MKTFAIKIIGCVYIKADTQEKAAEKLFRGLNCLPPEIYDFEYGTGIDGWEEIQEGGNSIITQRKNVGFIPTFYLRLTKSKFYLIFL